MEIKTKTVYDKDNLKKFLKVYYKEKAKIFRIIINILITCLIINFFAKDEQSVKDYIYFVIALLGILEINTNFIPWFNYFKMTKFKNSIINSKIDYLFKENNFKLTTTKDEYIDYKSLKKVIETADAYYLFINNSRSFIVDKKKMSKNNTNIITDRFKKNTTYIYKNNV